MFAVNTFGSVNCTKAVIPYMKRPKKSSRPSSIAVVTGGAFVPEAASYAASKANICGWRRAR